MVKFGYKLMTEEHGPAARVANAVRAEEAGFDFVSISDRFHPWLESHGHAPFARSVLGAIALATSRIGFTTGLTCPIIRYHPTIVAQAAATIAVMSEGCFTLAVGAGERLNEHVTGARWPSVPERHAMLGEAIDIFRLLWSGRARSHKGDSFVVDHARLYDLPAKPIPVIVGVSGPHSVALAAEKADGILAIEPKRDLVTGFRVQSAGKGPCYSEVTLAWAKTEAEGRKLAHDRFRFSALGWAVNSALPTVEGIEAATKFVTPDDLADTIPAGPDVEPHLEAITKHRHAGFDRIVLLGVGPDQAGLIEFVQSALLPRLRSLKRN